MCNGDFWSDGDDDHDDDNGHNEGDNDDNNKTMMLLTAHFKSFSGLPYDEF